MTDNIWNPWHGCKKYSDGCKNCYVYRRDNSIGKDPEKVEKTLAFDKPLKKDRNGDYKIKAGTLVYLCMTSDFFIEKADGWRDEIWEIIKKRQDLNFMIITKRILRFYNCIPKDWGSGYNNVFICCTVENQKECDSRLPFFKTLPIKKKFIASEPLLTPIDMERYLDSTICRVTVGGESGYNARICDYAWILDIRRQCMEKNVPFYFKQTGAKFKKDGKIYIIERKFQHSQAKLANINT